MRENVVLKVWMLTFAIAAGCDIAGSDRCGSGDKFYWDPQTQKCHLSETDSDSESSDIDTTTTTDTGTDDDGVPSGLGEPCTEPAECEGFEANHCTAKPIRPEGYCTVKDCEPGECPAAYRCCDCTVAGMGISCTKDADALLAEQYMDCSCS